MEIKKVTFITNFESHLTEPFKSEFRSLDSPFKIQLFLDNMPYIAEQRDRSPVNVIQDRQCHCLDGGLFAALALWRLGFLPLLVDMVPNPGEDDDHVLAVYKVDGRWGAIAKSNYVNLGFREPVYRDIRELVMTYFEHYCNVNQSKTLRGYSRVFDCSKYTRYDWATNETETNILFYKHFYGRTPIEIVKPGAAQKLNPLTDRAYRAETLYTDLSWSFGIREDH